MKGLVAVATILSLLSFTTPAVAADHLVPLTLVQERLAEASQRRTEDLAALRLVLSSPAGRQVAAVTHADPGVLAAGLSTLSDRELHDLADRAARLDADPAAGMSGLAKGVLIALAVIVVAWGIAILVYASSGD